MVYDLDLAGDLGYSQPRDIRKLLTRMLGDGKLGTDGDRATVARSEEGRGVKAFYLGEKAPLKVVTKSETPKADAITDQVIDTFIRARNG